MLVKIQVLLLWFINFVVFYLLIYMNKVFRLTSKHGLNEESSYKGELFHLCISAKEKPFFSTVLVLLRQLMQCVPILMVSFGKFKTVQKTHASKLRWFDYLRLSNRWVPIFKIHMKLRPLLSCCRQLFF